MKFANFVFGIFFVLLFCSILSADPSITVEKPNGGEYIAAGSSYEIQWSSTDVETVYILYSVNSGANWDFVDANAQQDTGSYLWQPVASEESQECFLQIADACDINFDISDANFTIYTCLAELAGDINRDCYVNFKDVAIVANEWLDCGNPYDPDCGFCPPGWADCDMMPDNGCEVYLLTNVYHCGQCYYSCFDLPYVFDVVCVAGGCVINSCMGSYGDCDGIADNGCETDLLSSVLNCGSCGNNCLNLNHVELADCVAGSCVINRCDSGFEDCDGQVSNGCEININSDPYNCGECDYSCYDLPNVTQASCLNGVCQIQECLPGFYDCDGESDNGCETYIYSDPHNCGACDYDCYDLPNVSQVSCSGGVCQIGSCAAGFANCDGIPNNGCEVNLDSDPSCGTAEYLGEICGDDGCTSGPTRNDYGEAWYRIYVEECDDGIFGNDLQFKATLQVPAGMDYDLYLYENNCTNVVDRSMLGGDADETVYYSWSDNVGYDDSKMLYIQVIYFDGESCSNWTLRTYGDCAE
jgi:hypothetical protein